MKKLLVIFILLFCSVFLCGCTNGTEKSSLDEIKERGYLIVGLNFNTKPFGFIENGELKGFDVDIAKNIAKNIFDDESKIEFIEITSETRLSKLLSGEIDIIVSSMTDTQERRALVDFSDTYYVTGQAILCKKDTEVSSAADLKNHNTVVVIGSTAEKTLKKLYISSNVIRALTLEEAYNAVNKDTCLIEDDALLQGFVMDHEGYQIFNKKLSEEPYAIAIRKNESQLKQEVDYTLKALDASGELEKIKRKWVK